MKKTRKWARGAALLIVVAVAASPAFAGSGGTRSPASIRFRPTLGSDGSRSVASGSFRPTRGAGGNTSSPASSKFRPTSGSDSPRSVTSGSFRPTRGRSDSSPASVALKPARGVAKGRLLHGQSSYGESPVSQSGHRAFRVRR